MLENSIFFILALFLVGGSIGMISFRQSVFSAISFLLAMIAMSGMFALLHFSFLFLAQILVSVGAVVVMSLLIIVSVNIKSENLPNDKLTLKRFTLSAILISPIVALLFYAINKTDLMFKEVNEEFGSLKLMGVDLFSNWALAFEIISILLLVALVGGIVISKRSSNYESR
ncbi:MAG: NADH-quinone oxidoreductase subunit J [Helicobacteraceae bacterium]|nr:NADH-quinone oxidoreductase subunit J [Helicobacteraceae bacterium]